MLNDYAEVRPLGEDTYLVKKGETLFVRKKASAHLYALYQSLIGIACPNLPKVYEVYSYPDFAVVKREYVKGEPLSLILEREKTLPLSEAKRIVKGVSNALFVLHKKTIIHRDVNPNNIIVSDSSVTLIDFAEREKGFSARHVYFRHSRLCRAGAVRLFAVGQEGGHLCPRRAWKRYADWALSL